MVVGADPIEPAIRTVEAVIDLPMARQQAPMPMPWISSFAVETFTRIPPFAALRLAVCVSRLVEKSWPPWLWSCLIGMHLSLTKFQIG